MTRQLARSPEELIEYFKEMQRNQPNDYILIAPNGDVYIEKADIMLELLIRFASIDKFSIDVFKIRDENETVKASAEQEGKASN